MVEALCLSRGVGWWRDFVFVEGRWMVEGLCVCRGELYGGGTLCLLRGAVWWRGIVFVEDRWMVEGTCVCLTLGALDSAATFVCRRVFVLSRAGGVLVGGGGFVLLRGLDGGGGLDGRSDGN